MAEREGFLLAPTRSRGATHRKLAHSLPTHALLIPPSKKTKKTPLGVFFVFAGHLELEPSEIKPVKEILAYFQDSVRRISCALKK